MKKVLIIGGSGFLGRKLKEKLKAETLSRRKGIKADIRDLNSLSFLRRKKYDVVIHLAAKIFYTWLPWFQSWREFYETNVKGTENVLKVINTKYFVYISSLAVYESQKLKKIKPRSFYGLTKYLGELKCKEYSKNKKMKLLIVRLPMVYDPKEPRREFYLFKKFGRFLLLFRTILKNRKIRVITRNEAIKEIIKLVKAGAKGTKEIKGNFVSLSEFIEMGCKKKIDKR